MDLKKIIAVSSLVIGALGVYIGYKNFSEDVGLPEVLEYVQSHPEHNEEIVNHSIRCKIKGDVPYSVSTLKTFSEVVLYQAIQNQLSSGEYSLRIPEKKEEAITNLGTESSILDRLTPEEKWALIQEGFFYGSKKVVNNAADIGSDFYDKMKETKLYGVIGGKK